MGRNLTLLVGALVLPSAVSLHAEDAVLGQLYGSGVHASGPHDELRDRPRDPANSGSGRWGEGLPLLDIGLRRRGTALPTDPERSATAGSTRSVLAHQVDRVAVPLEAHVAGD